MKLDELFETLVSLLETGNYQKLRALLSECEPFDLAQLCEDLEESQLPIVFRLMSKDIAAECFSEMSSDLQELLIRRMSDNELRAVLDELYIDDTVDIIEEMPANVVKRILANSSQDSRQHINRILNYPKDSVGSIMTVEYVRLDKSMTVEGAFARIRRVGTDKETIYTCYVTEPDRTLVGVVTVMDLLLGDNDTLISEIMETNVISASTDEDREEAVRKIRSYDFLALPVVDRSNRLVGIVTVDDAMDVAIEEATQDVEMMAAITPTDKPYLKVGVISTWLSRIPWLMLLMLSATLTGAVIANYEAQLSKLAVLTVFIPMLMGTAGNAGGQTSVTIIRALSTGEVELSDVLRIIWKELRVALLCGVSLAIVGYFKAVYIDNVSAFVALSVSITLLATVVSAKIVGCCFPLLIKKIGFDPAVVANPFITTVIDTLALIVYFTVASAVIPSIV